MSAFQPNNRSNQARQGSPRPPDVGQGVTGVSVSCAPTRSILIIDDMFNQSPWNRTLSDNGVEIQIIGVAGIEEAVAHIKEKSRWPDIISIDCHRAEAGGCLIKVAEIYNQRLLQLLQQIPNQSVKIIFHSLAEHGAEMNVPDSAFYSTNDILALMALANLDSHCFEDEPTKLIATINEVFGTSLPTDRESVEKLAAQSMKISPSEALQLILSGSVPLVSVLSKLEIAALNEMPVLDTVNSGAPSCRFLRSLNGAGVGRVAFGPDDVLELTKDGSPVILVAHDLTSGGTHQLSNLAGFVLLSSSAQNMHASLTLRAARVPSLLGAMATCDIVDGKLIIDSGATVITKGQFVSIGPEVLYPEALRVQVPNNTEAVRVLATQAKNWCSLYFPDAGVSSNANTVLELQTATEAGATGLFHRTERGFLGDDLCVLRNLLLNTTNGLEAFRNTQQKLFQELLSANRLALPLTIRLLDAALQDFLSPEDINSLRAAGEDPSLRGAAYAMTKSGLYSAQIEALFLASDNIGYRGELNLIVPGVSEFDQLGRVKKDFDEKAQKYPGRTVRFGAMVEAQLGEDHIKSIAPICSLVSFGGNDLTSNILGIGRADYSKIAQYTFQHGFDPYGALADEVASKIGMMAALVKENNPAMNLAVCGDQVSGNYQSIKLCVREGIPRIAAMPTTQDIHASWIMLAKAIIESQALTEAQKTAAAGLKAVFDGLHLDWPNNTNLGLCEVANLVGIAFAKIITDRVFKLGNHHDLSINQWEADLRRIQIELFAGIPEDWRLILVEEFAVIPVEKRIKPEVPVSKMTSAQLAHELGVGFTKILTTIYLPRETSDDLQGLCHSCLNRLISCAQYMEAEDLKTSFWKLGAISAILGRLPEMPNESA